MIANNLQCCNTIVMLYIHVDLVIYIGEMFAANSLIRPIKGEVTLQRMKERMSSV